jgi:hypothetical protein
MMKDKREARSAHPPEECGSVHLPPHLTRLFEFWRESDSWSLEKRTRYWAEEERLAREFGQEVLDTLENQSVPMTPDQFDEAADQIEKAAPNLDAVLLGLRVLGKHYVKERGYGLRPSKGS